jgi:hypothetical protein
MEGCNAWTLYTEVGSNHMKKALTLIFGLLVYCVPSVGQLTLKGLKFDSWFGYELDSKKETTYCLLGIGFFKAPRAENTDSLISTWTIQHPSALVIPVYTSGPTMTDSKESKMIYSWVVDKSDTLNILLVRHGCIPGATLQRPQTWKEMGRKKRRLWYDNKKPKEEVHVDDEVYKDFLDKVAKAETSAKMKKLGIWAQNKE